MTMRFPRILVIALGLPILVAACGEDEKKPDGASGSTQSGATKNAGISGGGSTDTKKSADGADGGSAAVAAKCTANMKLMTAANAQMKPLVGNEARVCSCLVGKFENDKSLTEADRSAIYAGLSAKPGSDAGKAAQAKMTDAGNKAVMTAMAACSQEFMKK